MYGRSALGDVAIAVRLRRAWVEEVGPFLDDIDHDLARLWPATHLRRRGLVLDLGTPVDFGLGDPFGDGVGETILRMLGSATHGAIRDLTWHHNAAMGPPTRQKAGRLDVFAPGDPVDMKLEQASAAISKRLRVESEAAAEALGGLRVAAVGRHMVWLAATDDRAAKAIGTTPGAASGLYEAVRKWQKATPKYCTYADESIAANSPALQPTF
ncbi:hypothetical protein [Ornithinimicrobium tianjinense]|uniref:hypothetical protein n=1 Tax=Ornithinimicrobium tianjinense TaxID=1195761 RepID=UPI00166E339B|nr:hypothetical protein [Ornithinimicrobium tianjinense]